MTNINSITMITDDFQKVSTTFYSHKQEIKAAIVICPALGVEHVFYQNFTLWLAEQGYWVVTFDYSGQNNYKNQKIKKSKNTITDWARHDCKKVLEQVVLYVKDKV